jgi:hypothetical protein
MVSSLVTLETCEADATGDLPEQHNTFVPDDAGFLFKSVLPSIHAWIQSGLKKQLGITAQSSPEKVINLTELQIFKHPVLKAQTLTKGRGPSLPRGCELLGPEPSDREFSNLKKHRGEAMLPRWHCYLNMVIEISS